ncbi:DUF413 domain-containing protein [Colwellia sp. Bg11-28]|uniref:DUF413 domain-containing protein n=1 Tax=Colwellia sp. Bg11-28 TaxID=2058305 RepID=UPI000C333FC8|nr:DUF413 domain-containing protein [Colwellia sp. Bg11-28]PKH87235.1 hypothetical protein CXF79_11135 [Colwellia sp. Bg11-28]
MPLVHGFIFENKFYDDTHFPHGFGKTGDFTIAEAEILTDIGRRLHMLEQEVCTPTNEVEKQFSQMCKEQSEGQTRIELLWQKYRRLTVYKPFHNLNGGRAA